MINVDIAYSLLVVALVVEAFATYWQLTHITQKSDHAYGIAGIVGLILFTFLAGVHSGSIYHPCKSVDYVSASCKDNRK